MKEWEYIILNLVVAIIAFAAAWTLEWHPFFAILACLTVGLDIAFIVRHYKN